MLIVCDNFKEKKILSFKKTSETFIHGKQTCSGISRCDVIQVLMSCTCIDLKSTNQTVLTCAGILFCSLIFVFLSNVKQRDS